MTQISDTPRAKENPDEDKQPLNETFQEVLRRRASRRGLLKGAAMASPLVVMAAAGFRLDGSIETPAAEAATRPSFKPVPPGTTDKIVVPDGYKAQVLLRWGDALFPGVFNLNTDPGSLNQTSTQQELRFGYNCDFVGFFPLPMGSGVSDHGLLTVNHEYTDNEIMFIDYDPDNLDSSWIDVELAAHGMSVVEVMKSASGSWSYAVGSEFNRRLTGDTWMELTGPAAGHALLKTSYDDTGKMVRGMLNNCGGGKTPWGTVLTCEENFNQYFANASSLPKDSTAAKMATRYGVTAGATANGWEQFYSRFDVEQEPNEVNRFGYVIEIDPYDPDFMPKKRTALGRTKHEAANTTLGKAGNAVVYSGDDERFDYLYKFVSKGKYDAANRSANLKLLDSGTLYVAKFKDDGTGTWIPMVAGEGALTAANGFASQGDVSIFTRKAADLLGATAMDRPEDVEISPKTGMVYMACTNNSRRTEERIDKANPRANNVHGHVIEITEDGNDAASKTFKWSIFILCGDADDGALYGGFTADEVSPFSAPDNLAFDSDGNLWVSTDGQPSARDEADGVFAIPVAGSQRGKARQFLSAPIDAEVTGPEFTPDNLTFFIAIQHPGEGEGSTLASPSSTWPDGKSPPKPSVLAITRTDGGVIGL